MISGVSLKADDAVLVCLLQTEEGDAPMYSPIALPIRGTYDRLGAIDGIQDDTNTDLILHFFRGALESGEFVLDPEFSLATIDPLLRAIERNINDSPNIALWDNRPVMFALISQEIRDALVKGSAASMTEVETPPLFQRVFGDSPLARGIYGGNLAEIAEPLKELATISDFLAERGLAWHPEEDASQHYEEVREFLEEARSAFADSALILAGLDDYERKMGSLLEEN